MNKWENNSFRLGESGSDAIGNIENKTTASPITSDIFDVFAITNRSATDIWNHDAVIILLSLLA